MNKDIKQYMNKTNEQIKKAKEKPEKMNKEVEEALKKVLDYAVSPQYENVLILKQAFEDMKEERKQRDETEQSLSKWIVELENKLDEIEDFIRDIENDERDGISLDLKTIKQILKEE